MGLAPDPFRLSGREESLGHTLVETLVVFPVPRATVPAPEVELVVERVEAHRRAAKWVLEVHVPAREGAVRPLPEHPYGVGVPRALEHEHAVPLPGAVGGPRMQSAGPAALGEAERRSLGKVDGQELRLVEDDDHRHARVRKTPPDVTADDDVPGPAGGH